MKRQLGWRRVPRQDLARHLREVEIVASEAVGESSIYHCRSTSGESIAISLPGEVGLIVDIAVAVPPALDRRRRRAAAGSNAD
ncbi:hypothetical protein [Azospira restricta]|uniref:Uncharacterized protein n=1 Tax=Azospira restricta TaxID=404405 RepID=A0A974PYJ6_9RHOO|nr:hypothetical protein [Azospira restricta]QRJ63529.1 hypothetical protein IWH25_17595 [Azospira restricta]